MFVFFLKKRFLDFKKKYDFLKSRFLKFTKKCFGLAAQGAELCLGRHQSFGHEPRLAPTQCLLPPHSVGHPARFLLGDQPAGLVHLRFLAAKLIIMRKRQL